MLTSTSARAADSLAGAYRAAQLFCFLPYQLLLSVTFVLFPLLSSAHRDGDHQAVARYVRTGVRLALVLAGLMVSVTAGLSGPLLRLVFGKDTAAFGAEAMFFLALGLGSFAIFGILATVLTSLKHEVMSMLLTLVALVLVVVLCFVLVRGQAFGAGMLVRTAWASGSGLLLATLITAAAVKAKAGAVVAPITVVRVVIGVAIAVTAARALPAPGKLATLAYAALVGVVYLTVLAIGRELTRADVRLVAGVVGRRS
jgi:stage V sporulation protein B